MCSSVSNPDFLLQKPFAHGTRSCIKTSAFLKSFAVFIFLLQKSGWSDNSGSAVSQTLWLCTNIMTVYKHYDCVQTLWLCTNVMSVYKRVNSRSHDIILKNSAGRDPYFVTYVLKCYESTIGPLMSFPYNIFPDYPIRKHGYISLILNVAVVP